MLSPPAAPSTSGDSESTVPRPNEKSLDVGVLKELVRTSLVETLNEVGHYRLLRSLPLVMQPEMCTK